MSEAAAADAPLARVFPMDLTSVLRPMAAQWRLAWAFSLLAGLLVLAPSVHMLQVYDRVINSRSHSTLALLTLAVVLAYVLMELLAWVRGEMLREVGQQADQRLSPRLFDLSFEASLKAQPGLAFQCLDDWRVVREFLASPFVVALMEAPVALLFLGLMFLLNPLLGWVTLGGALLQTGLAWLTERRTQPPLQAANRLSATTQQYAQGALRNAEIIEAMGMLRSVHARWAQGQRAWLNLQAQASLASAGLQALSRMVQQMLGSALLGLAAWLLLEQQLHGGAGMMVVASVLGARVLAPLVQMVTQWRSTVAARGAWSRLNLLLTTFPPRPPAMALPAPQGVLTVERLSAAAPQPPGTPIVPILRNLQFALQPGELLAVLGPSASGKSTLARMLVGLWPALGGKVRLDGVDVHHWDKTELGPHLGYLPQGVELLDGTLADNIARFGPPDATKLANAARAAGLQDLIDALPQGYDTPLGRDGARLSGGQRQRVALARALYGDPRLVVLDEPNSSLDQAGDAALLEALRHLKARGAVVVLMTHRSSVLALCDKLLLLAEGTQRAFGPRDEILAMLQQNLRQKPTLPAPLAVAA